MNLPLQLENNFVHWLIWKQQLWNGNISNKVKGKNIQVYTREFKRKALSLGIPIYARENILKYIGGMHSYLQHTIMMFNPTNIDEVSIQDTHLED
jgi:hypothetical protein